VANTTQAADWNGEIGEYWAAHDDHYDAMLAHLISAARSPL
jgi:hypothetical protein